MKSKVRRWIAIFVVTMSICGSVFTTVAQDQNITSELMEETINNLRNGYMEYYNVLDSRTILYSSHEIDGYIENRYLLEMDVVLKVDNVEDMDYYQGAIEHYDKMLADADKLQIKSNMNRANMIASECAEIYAELEKYIGKEQELVFIIEESYPVDDEANKTILFESGADLVTWDKMLPFSHEELKEQGYARMESKVAENVMVQDATTMNLARSSYSYVASDAINYMVRYSSNPTSCNVCGGNSSCGMYVDTTKYNQNYSNYASQHADCANFVSQALCEGGIPTDNVWRAGSTAWINVSSLTNYMTSNGYWSSVTYNIVQPGDIVRYTSMSHVVMITAFDGATYRCSGHTNDQRNAVISISSSNKYYRPG